VCAYPKGSVFPHLAASIHRTYAERHGYGYIHHRDEEDRLSSGRPKAWTKVRALHEALEGGRHDWVLWADCDIYFMDLQTSLDSLLLRYASRPEAYSTPSQELQDANVIDPNVQLVITEDAQSLNTAIFLMRNSDWSRRLLRRAWGMDESRALAPAVADEDWRGARSPFESHPWWEQPAFTQALLGDYHRRLQDVDYPHVDSAPHRVLVPHVPEVSIAPQMEMNGYHVISSRLNEESTWVPGKFVLSFNGVKSLSGPFVFDTVAANYYEVFCSINRLQDRCARDLATFPVHDLPSLWHDSLGGLREARDRLKVAMFAPWLQQRASDLPP